MQIHFSQSRRVLWFFLPLVVLGQPSQPNQLDVDATQRNLLLTTHLTSTLQNELSRAATAGYRVVAASKAYAYFPDFLVLMERVVEPTETYNYLVVATQKPSTFEKELGEAGTAGFRLLPHTMMLTPAGEGLLEGEILDKRLVGGEIFAVMEKPPNSANEYEYRVDVTTHTLELAANIERRASEGYTVTGMVSRMYEKTLGTGGLQYVVVAEKPRRAAPLPPGAGSRPDVLQRYRVLQSYPGAELQGQLEQAAGEGYCLRLASALSERLPERSGTEADDDCDLRLASALASRRIVAILEKAGQPPDGCQYLLLSNPKRSSLNNELQRAGAQGFRPHPAGIFQTPLAVIMEKAPGGADRFQYVLIETKSFSKFEKQFKEASTQGYRAVGASRTGEIPMVILEKPAGARAEPATARTATSKQASAVEQGKGSGKPFTNADVLELAKAGFGEETILEAIRTKECRFDTSTEAVLALKNAGVSEKIIMAILAAGRAPGGPSAPSSESGSFPARVGIYVLKDGTYIPLEIEPVQWRSRAFGGVTTSDGVSRTTLKADMATPESPVQLSASPEFLLVCAGDVTKIEYHLLRAEHNKKNREFRAEFQVFDDGSHVALGGTRKNKVHFTAKDLAAGKFRLKLPELAKGEYAFLPPTRGLNGTLYTFGVR